VKAAAKMLKLLGWTSTAEQPPTYVTTQNLEPSHYVVWPLPEKHLLAIKVEVRSGPPVRVFLLDSQNHDRFQSRHTFTYSGIGTVVDYLGTTQLPHPGPWFLILENVSDEPVVVDVSHQGL
jgi:hypothetical protein